tara:strand:+ start:1954 stop:2352 length:399 start_codon:yes stop_codon:yes gene_type:complete
MLKKITEENVTLTLSHNEFEVLHNMLYFRGDSHLYDIGEEKGIKDFDDEHELEKFYAIPEVSLGFTMITEFHYDIWMHGAHQSAIKRSAHEADIFLGKFDDSKDSELSKKIKKEWKDKFKFWLDDPEKKGKK